MGTQCRVRGVGRVDFTVIQVQYVTYVETRRSRLTARHFYTVQKSVVSQVVVVRVVRWEYLPAAGLVSTDRLSSATSADYGFLGAERDQGASRIGGLDVVVVVVLLL